MKKKILKTVSIALSACLLLGIGAVAAVNSEEITALLSYDVNVEYNGKVQTFKDANNKRVYPIVYEGTTYLPVRAVSNMLGVSVDWNESTKTVILGKEEAKKEEVKQEAKIELHNLTETKFYSLKSRTYNDKRYRYIEFDVDDTSKFYYFGFEYSSSYDAPRIYKVLDPSNKEVKYSSANLKNYGLELAENCDEFKYSYSNKFIKKGKYKVLFSVSDSANYEYVKVKSFYTDRELKK